LIPHQQSPPFSIPNRTHPPAPAPWSSQPPPPPSSPPHPNSPKRAWGSSRPPSAPPAGAQSTQSNDPPSSPCTQCNRSPPYGNPARPIPASRASRTVYASHTPDTRPDFPDQSASSAPDP